MPELADDGFEIVQDVLTDAEITAIVELVSNADTSSPVFRRSKELFAIRQFLKQMPDVADIVMGSKMGQVLKERVGSDHFVVKSIYFDKPSASNWFVSYHQDLTISVKERRDVNGFGPWTVKEGQYAVQPPLDLLEDNITVRLHLDMTSGENGALKVIKGSHLKGIYRPETINWDRESEVVCEVPRGGAMLMKPLLLHSSGRTVNNEQRRVIHIEFSRRDLPDGLQWAELLAEDTSNRYFQ